MRLIIVFRKLSKKKLENCWGEGEDATLRSSLRLSRCANESRRTGEVHPSPLHYETKAYDDVAPSHVLTRP